MISLRYRVLQWLFSHTSKKYALGGVYFKLLRMPSRANVGIFVYTVRMFPLNKRVLVHDSAWHLKMREGIAADYFAVYDQLFAPFDGVVTNPYWSLGTGGKWLRLTRPNGEVIEFAHLSQRIKTGPVKQGDLIGVTGNTGLWSYGPHAHFQIFRNGRRIPPEDYNWDEVDSTEKMIKQLFQKVWDVPPATGDWKYFAVRLANGTLKAKDLESTMAYWKTRPDVSWQKEKQLYLK